LLEATGAEGVAAAYWDDFIKYNWKDLYNKIVYRPLYFNKTDDDIIKLEKMIKV